MLPSPLTRNGGARTSGDEPSQTSCGVAAKVPTIPNWPTGRVLQGMASVKKRETCLVALVRLIELALSPSVNVLRLTPRTWRKFAIK